MMASPTSFTSSPGALLRPSPLFPLPLPLCLSSLFGKRGKDRAAAVKASLLLLLPSSLSPPLPSRFCFDPLLPLPLLLLLLLFKL